MIFTGSAIVIQMVEKKSCGAMDVVWRGKGVWRRKRKGGGGKNMHAS